MDPETRQPLCPTCDVLLTNVHDGLGYCVFCQANTEPKYVRGSKRMASDEEIAQYRHDIIKTNPNGSHFTLKHKPVIN